MFSTLKQKLLLGFYIFIVLSIPVGAYLASEYRTIIKSSASEKKIPKPVVPITPKPATPSAKKQLLENIMSTTAATTGTASSPAPGLDSFGATPAPTAAPEPSSPTIATSFGPTLSLKVSLEGRSDGNQSTKLFVGIIEGAVTANPKFLLNFNVDLPDSGEFANLSLAGLTVGSQYTALLKGITSLASSVTFTMSPAVTTLNNSNTVALINGDLNEDNVINSADYAIVQKALGATPTSGKWVENTDLNKDRLVNMFDIAIVTKNLGKTGDSGAWTSPIPKVATASAGLTSPTGSLGQGGYWIWVPIP